eukprot:964210-Pelagomonas_calceolata.AAC.1
MSKAVVSNNHTACAQFNYPCLPLRGHAGIVGIKCTDANAKHPAIQGNDTPADMTFPCVNLEGNHFRDTYWLAFEEAARTHTSTPEHPNSPTPKLQHNSNLNGALHIRIILSSGSMRLTPKQDTTLLI